MTTIHDSHSRISQLHPPTPEDIMEVSTDMDPHIEASEDIDIDLDLGDDIAQDEEDEFMGEDDDLIADVPFVNRDELLTMKDDEMADDGGIGGSVTDRSSVRDEYIQDAGYLILEHDDGEGVELTVNTSSDRPLEVIDEQKHFDDAGEVYELDQEGQHLDHGSTQELEASEQQEQQNTYDDQPGDTAGSISDELEDHNPGLASQMSLQEMSEHPTDVGQVLEANSHVLPGTNKQTSSQEAKSDNYAKPQGSTQVITKDVISDIDRKLEPVPDSSLAQVHDTASAQADIRPQEEATALESTASVGPKHVHPVVMVYQESEISLFPLISQGDDEEEKTASSTYFLQDEQVANESIQTLFGAIRSVLGESVGEHDELTFDIEDLDLHIGESSVECSTTSMSEVLNVYVHLQHYDGLDHPPPLYVNLTARAKFSKRFEELLGAIGEGKGLSETRPIDDEDHEQLEDQGEESTNTEENPLQGSYSELNPPASPREEHDVSDNLADASHSITSHLTDDADEVNDETVADTTSRQDVGSRGPSGTSPINRTKTPLQSTLSTEPDIATFDEPVVDHDDFIGYDEDDLEEPILENSSRSSTLQGDAFNVVADETNMERPDNVSSGELTKVNDMKVIVDSAPGKGGVTNTTLRESIIETIIETPLEELLDEVSDDADHLNQEEENPVPPSEEGNTQGAEQLGQSLHLEVPFEENAEFEQGWDEPQVGQQEMASAQEHLSPQDENIAPGGGDTSQSTLLDSELQNGQQSNCNEPTRATKDFDDHNDVFQDEKVSGLVNTTSDPSGVIPTLLHVDNGSSPAGNTQHTPTTNIAISPQEDDDEITYEDEDEVEIPTVPQLVDLPEPSSPGSLKRIRSHDEEEIATVGGLQDSKRLRST